MDLILDVYCQECEEIIMVDLGENLPEGILVNYGMGLKDEALAQAIEEAFRKHGYKLADKLKELK
jgi:hypothetical protein